MKRWILFLLSEALIFYVALIYHSQSLLFFVVSFLILIVCLLLHNLLVFRQVRVELKTGMNIVEQGMALPLELRFTNRSFLPSGQIRFYIRIHYQINGKKQKKSIQFAMSGRKIRHAYSDEQRKIRISFYPEYTGFVTLRIKRARIFDLFGLLPLPVSRKHIYGTDRILVLPQREEIFLDLDDRKNTTRFPQEMEFRVQGEQDPPEVSQIREYQPGDALRKIHWKLTAKRDELMVCEHISEQICPLVFFVDFGELTEAFMKRFYSIAMELLQQDKSFYLAYYDPETMEVTRCQILKEENFYEYLLQMNISRIGEEHAEWEKEYSEKYRLMPGFAKIVLWRDLRYEVIL